MTLTDASALIAVIDSADPNHARCQSALKRLPPGGLVTTWPCLAEAVHILYRDGGWPFVAALMKYTTAGVLRVHHADDNELARVVAIMTQYRDLPCDLADASLVAAAETLGATQIFTLDSHFYAYRQADGSAFAVVP